MRELEKCAEGLDLCKAQTNPKTFDQIQRFYEHTIIADVAGLFLASGNNVVTALRRIGHDEACAPALRLLDQPLGTTTLRAVLGEYRNIFLAHPQFSIRAVINSTKRKLGFDMEVPHNAISYGMLRNELFHSIAEMRVEMECRFPEAYSSQTH